MLPCLPRGLPSRYCWKRPRTFRSEPVEVKVEPLPQVVGRDPEVTLQVIADAAVFAAWIAVQVLLETSTHLPIGTGRSKSRTAAATRRARSRSDVAGHSGCCRVCRVDCRPGTAGNVHAPSDRNRSK